MNIPSRTCRPFSKPIQSGKWRTEKGIYKQLVYNELRIGKICAPKRKSIDFLHLLFYLVLHVLNPRADKRYVPSMAPEPYRRFRSVLKDIRPRSQRTRPDNLYQMLINLHHQCCYQSQDGIKFRKGGINHRIGLHVMSLSNAHNTVRTNLPLTDAGNHTYQTDSQTDT